MAESTSQGLGDLFALFGGNPLTSFTKNVENFRAAVDGSLSALANLNRTLESLDGVAQRVAALLDEVEGPIRVLVPQMTKISQQSLQLFEQLAGPLDRVVPGLDQLADTLTSPMFTTMPNVLGDFLETLRELATRLRPLGQMAEAAGAMFGMRGFGAMRTSASAQAAAEPAASSGVRQAPAPASEPAATAATPKRAAGTKTRAKAGTKAGAKKAATRRSAATASAAKKTGAKASAVTQQAAAPAPAKKAGGASATASGGRRMSAGRRPSA